MKIVRVLIVNSHQYDVTQRVMKSLLKSRLFYVALTFGCFLSSCASGPSYADAQSTLPSIPKGKGRVFVYRPSAFGAAVKPDVQIDQNVVGRSEGRGFFYSDLSTGSHEVSIKTEMAHKNTVTVQAGKPSFVKCSIMPGLLVGHVLPKQVDQATGSAEIQKCKLSK